MPAPWSIWYEDGRRVDGETREDWDTAPDEGVQAIVEWRPPERENREIRWTGVTDRVLWTGDEFYDPFGWGFKVGTLAPDETYWAIWEEAAYGNH